MKKTTITGLVRPGRRLGRTLGFPTANITVAEQADVPNGVYRSRVEITGEEGKRYEAMSNLGHNPTVENDGQRRRLLETYLFDFAGGDLYGKTLKVELLEKIRDEQRFASLDALKAQLEKDQAHIKSLI